MRRYLLVDDNQELADNVAEILIDLGAEADVVRSAAEALERIQRTRYDALVTDMRMPVMSGAELVQEMRRVDPDLPAIVVTAYTGDDDLASAREQGVLAVLPKPVPIDRLVELLGKARRSAIVALIEDDPDLLDNLQDILQSRGITTVTACSIIEAERLGAVRPFAGIVDLRVRGGDDGRAMVVLAKKFPGLPLFVMTAHADQEPPAEHVGLFRKPFDTGALVAAIDQLYAAQHA